VAYNSTFFDFFSHGDSVFVSDRNIFKVNAASKKPKVKSLKEAIVILEDVTECLTSENLTETVNDLSKVLSNNYSVPLAESQKRPYRVTDFIKRIRYCASFKNNTIPI